MPEGDGTSKVLEEYVATKNANPQMSDDVLKAKFPEIGGFAVAKGVDEGVIMSNLNTYYDDYRSGNYGSFEELNTKNNFFFPATTEEVVSSTETVATPEGTEEIQSTTVQPEQTPAELTDNVLQEYVATRNANPQMSDDVLKSKFPEIDSYAQLKGIDSGVVINDLNGYYDDYRSGDFTFEDLNSKYGFSEGLVKKKETPAQDPQTGQPIQTQQVPGQEVPDDFLAQSEAGAQLGSASDGSTSGLNLQEQDDFLASLPKNEGDPFEFVPPTISRAEAMTEFYSSAPKVNQTFEERQAQTGLLADDLEEKIDESEDLIITELSFRLGLDEETIRENVDKWSLQHSVLDPEGNTIPDTDPQKGMKLVLRNRHANAELLNSTKEKKKNLFNEALDLTGGDVDKATELFNKKGDEIGFNFLSENDLKIKMLKDSISELRSKDRTIDEDIKLKSLEKQLDTAIEIGFAGEDLFDPETGKFLSDNKKEEIPQETQEFNDRVQELSLKYEDTDVATLRKIRDDAYIRYLTFKEFSQEKLTEIAKTGTDNVESIEAVKKYKKREQELLADFMASNRMLTLNEDPGTVAEEGFFGSIGEGFKEGVDIVSERPSALADRGIKLLESAGVELTPEQQTKLNKTFTQKLGRTIGTSIPISIEIGANLFLGNKAAGILKIPRLAKIIANGNKMKQFGLTMLYETGLQGSAFAVSGETFSSGVGEGVGQVLGSALLSRFGVKNKFLNFGVRALSGATTETMAEFSGQFFEEMSNNGFDIDKAAEETFGKTPEETMEKIALTYMTALVMGVGGASQESTLFLEEAQKEIQASDSKSPIVEAAKDMDVTTPMTEEETVELSDLRTKVENSEELSEEEFNRAELLETKRIVNDVNTKNITEESSPVILVNDEAETKYEANEGKGKVFVKEKELLKKLESSEFIDKVKAGNTELDITNPSPEVEQKIKEKFPESPEVEQLKLQFEEETTKTTDGETKTETDDTITEPISETETKAKTETIQKSVDSLDTVADEVSKVAEGLAPLSTKKVFDAVIDTAKNIVEETGLKGEELITEIKTRMSEKLGESFDVEQINDISTEITEATKGIELKAIPVADVKEKKISDTTNKIADKILSAKFEIGGLDQLSSDPIRPLIKAAINTSLTATAETIRLGGNIVQAVSDGVEALKQSEWYKALSPEGQKQAEANVSEQLKNITESEQANVSETEEGVVAKDATTETEAKVVWKSGEPIKKSSTPEQAAEFVERHKEEIVNDYIDNHEAGKEGIIDPDAIRDYLEELGYDGKNVPDYVSAGHTLTDAIFDRMLETQTNKTFAVLSGVGGAGKTRAVKGDGKVNLDNKGIVFDSAFNHFKDLDSVIKKAKKAGFEVEVVPVYNDIKTAFSNTVDRGKRKGRFLSLDYFIGSFVANNGKIKSLVEAHPDVKMTFIDNSGNQPSVVSVKEAKGWNYKPTNEEIVELLKSIENDTELKETELTSISEGLGGIRQHVREWTSEMEGLVGRINGRLLGTEREGVSGEVEKDTRRPKKRVRKVRLEKEPEVKKEAGAEKLNPKNKRFAERIDKQSTVSSDTKEKILAESENVVSNQKELVKQSKKIFDQVMAEGTYQDVIKIADSERVNPDMREMLYGQVMQHLSELEKSSDPTISKAASNDLVDLGIKTAERLNKAGKQIKAIGTIYNNFPMYALYSSVSRIETFATSYNSKKSTSKVNPGSIKKEASADVLDVISDIEENLGDFLKQPEIAKRLKAIKQKMEKRSVRPKGLTGKRKAELEKKRKEIIKKFRGQKKKDKLQSGIPFGDQIVAVIEYAATLIEEGFYRSQDIVSGVMDAFNSAGAKFNEKGIKETLNNLQEFSDILESEKVSTKKDSFGDTVSGAVATYLKEGLKFSNMTMNEALVSSDKTKQQIKNDLIESLKSDFELDSKEAETVIKVIDQIFKEKAVQKLKAGFDKFYSPLSIKKATAISKAEKLANDVALGAFDTTLEFMDLTFQKHGMVNTNNPELITKLRNLSDKMRNAPDGVLKDRHRKNLETLIHQETNGYGFMDWLMSRFYGSILSGPITHAKNLKYNTFAVGIAGPVSQMYLKGANPIRTYKEMFRSFYKVDRKIASHYVKTGDNFVDPGLGPKTYADQLQFNLIKNGFTKLLNVASTRLLVSSDLIVTRPFASAVFKNHVKAWLRTTEGLKGRGLEKKATEMMGYTQENVDKSTKEALEDVKADYGFDPFAEDITNSVQNEASMLLLLRTQERILENSGIEEKIGTENWLDAWNGESLSESSTTEAKKLALQGEVNGAVGIATDLVERLTSHAPFLKFKVPFVRILGNMLNTGLKWTPGLGQLQAVSRYTINRSLAKKGMQTTSSSSLWALEKFQDKTGITLFKEGVLQGFNKESSQRQSSRDFKNAFFITGVQLLINSLLAKDDDDEGLVVTGLLDQSFFKRDSIEKGTGISPFTVYWRDADGNMTEISEYKNSATGFAFAFFGSWEDAKRVPGVTTTRLFLDAMGSSPFYIAEKPAFTSLKEFFDVMNPVDKYGNNKWLDDSGYKDKGILSVSKFINSMFVPNLFKQSEKIVGQVYGGEKSRSTNWWQELMKGVPFTDQIGTEAQYDHFGRPLEDKFELGFLGLKGSAEDGFSFLEPEEVDPYYEVYTNHGDTPKWFTDKEIPVYQPNENGVWEKSVIKEEGEKNETGKIRISKYEGHILNALIGQYRKEGIDNVRKSHIENGVLVWENGLEALNNMDNVTFQKERASIDKAAKERAFIYFFDNYYGEDIKFSNKEKRGTYLKVQ